MSETTVLCSTDVEMSTLGSCILREQALTDICALLQPEDFFLEGHRLIFKAMRDLRDRRQPVDLVTLKTELEKPEKGRDVPLSLVGGVEYLIQICEFVPSAANGKFYASEVKARANRRRRYESFKAAAAACLRSDVGEDEIEAMAMAMSERPSGTTEPFIESHDILLDDSEDGGIPTGFKGLDRLTQKGGWPKGQISVIMGDTKARKSWFLCQTAAHMAVEQDVHVAYITLADLDARDIKGRMLRQMCGWRKRPTYEGLAQKDFDGALASLDMAYWCVWDNTALESGNDVETILAWLESRHARKPLGAVVWDYAQETTTSDRRAHNDESEQRIISTKMFKFAKKLNIPMIVGSQITLDAKGKMQTMYARAWLHKAAWGLELLEDRVRIKYSRFGTQSTEDQEVAVPLAFEKGTYMKFFEKVTLPKESQKLL